MMIFFADIKESIYQRKPFTITGHKWGYSWKFWGINSIQCNKQQQCFHRSTDTIYIFLIIIYHYDSIIVFVVRNNFPGMVYIHTVGGETPLVIDMISKPGL